MDATITTVDAYIAAYPPEIRAILLQVRTIICETVPDATECISWQMPTYKWKGKPLVYFAGHKKHVGFYPLPSSIEALKDELQSYRQSGKGTIQFPYNKPIPLTLIAKIVRFRMTEIQNASLIKNIS